LGISEEAQDIITRCLFGNYHHRPGIEDLQCHKFFSKNRIPGTIPHISLFVRPGQAWLGNYIEIDKHRELDLNLPDPA
jgi:serine/threonine protein kinase